MKTISVLTIVGLFPVLALAHPGGHGTPEDPIQSLPKITTSDGALYGVDSLVKPDGKVSITLMDRTAGVISPKKFGFTDKADGEVVFGGAVKGTKFPLKLSGNFYEGSFKPGTGEPKVKVTFRDKRGKAHTVVLDHHEHTEGEE